MNDTAGEVQVLRLRLAEMHTALDNMQTAATQARAEADHYRGQYETAREDIDGFVEEIRALGDRLDAKDVEIARLRQQLKCRGVSR